MWKQIPQYPKYEVSKDGRVRGIYKEIKQITNRFGVKHVALYNRGPGWRKGKCEEVHRLVAAAFLPGEGEVFHIKDPGDNRVENLTRKKPIRIPAGLFYLAPITPDRPSDSESWASERGWEAGVKRERNTEPTPPFAVTWGPTGLLNSHASSRFPTKLY